jgi:hypothetical protein
MKEMKNEIEVSLKPIDRTRTPERPTLWIATAEINNVNYEAKSRYSPMRELARILLKAGVEDASFKVFLQGARGYMTIASFHEEAKWTIYEGKADGPRKVRWIDPAARFGHPATPDKK